MRLDARLGIAGRVAMTGEAINVADAYEHPLFYKEVDVKTGYRTQTLLAVPLKNSSGEIIGVGEAINKTHGRFTDEDAEVLQTVAAYVSDTIQTTQLDVQLRQHLLQKEGDFQDDHGGGFSTQNIIGTSHRIQGIIRLIDQIRESSVDVLIEGENGTGKELVAKALHYNSPRAKQPIVALNCAALPDNLVEAELFGIERGVATGVERRIGRFEEAHGGTLFLDEIGDLSLPAQAKILRVLQERSLNRVGGRTPIAVDVRIISATNKNLEAGMRANTFREDLYSRLKVIHIHTPPLREVPEDVPTLAHYFLAKHSRAMNIELKQFTPAALECLTRCVWPGNSRQLENEVKRLVVSVRGRSITDSHLDESIRATPPSISQPAPASEPASRSLASAVHDVERRFIEEALREHGGNKQKTAEALGLSRPGFFRKLKRLGIK